MADTPHTPGLWGLLLGGFPPHDVPFAQPADGPAEPQAEPKAERRLALVLAYRGTAYAGWQVQPDARTVQAEVEAALARLCDHPVRVAASGRTDAGVHAVGQVAAFGTASRLGIDEMARGLAALLPADIHPRRLGEVGPEFHPRYGALAKTYDYYLWPGAQSPLFLADQLWPIKSRLRAGPMRRALAELPGDRDLRAMASRGAEVEGSTVRRILGAELTVFDQGLWRVRLTATGFLRHVVRNLVGVLVQIGQGRLKPEGLTRMLAAGRRLYPGPKAPPGGLYLNRVYYRQLPTLPLAED